MENLIPWIAVLMLVIQYINDNKLKDNKKKIGALVLVLIGAISIYINQHIQKKKDNASELRTLQKDSINKINTDILLNKIDSLQGMLTPFVKLAEINFPDQKSVNALNLLFERIYKQDSKIQEQGKKIESQEDQIKSIKEYTYISRFGIDGRTGEFDYGIVEHSPLIEQLDKVVFIKDSMYQFECNVNGQNILKQIIKDNPIFPFSYYILAVCLRRNNNKEWLTYADKALEILKRTTSISGHHEHHDMAMKVIYNLKEQNK